MGAGGHNCVLFKQMHRTCVNLLRGQCYLSPHPVPGEEVESSTAGGEWGTERYNVQDTKGRRARGRPWLAAERRENKVRGWMAVGLATGPQHGVLHLGCTGVSPGSWNLVAGLQVTGEPLGISIIIRVPSSAARAENHCGVQLEPSVKEGVEACEEAGLYRIGERK